MTSQLSVTILRFRYGRLSTGRSQPNIRDCSTGCGCVVSRTTAAALRKPTGVTARQEGLVRRPPETHCRHGSGGCPRAAAAFLYPARVGQRRLVFHNSSDNATRETSDPHRPWRVDDTDLPHSRSRSVDACAQSRAYGNACREGSRNHHDRQFSRARYVWMRSPAQRPLFVSIVRDTLGRNLKNTARERQRDEAPSVDGTRRHPVDGDRRRVAARSDDPNARSVLTILSHWLNFGNAPIRLTE